MDHTKINYDIAKAKNTIPIDNPDWHEVTLAHYQELPDYVNDPALNRELELELLSGGWELYKIDNDYHWARAATKYDTCVIVKDNFGLATALAWLKMRGVE